MSNQSNSFPLELFGNDALVASSNHSKNKFAKEFDYISSLPPIDCSLKSVKG